MPVYEYICNNCSRTFSVIKFKLSDGETLCPECGSGEVTKKLSTFSCGISSGYSSSGGG